jgi:aminoglycoside phosphotransferase family enzyme/predicted kinase
MIVGDQTQTIAFLRQAAAEAAAPVETISTHISIVLLAGERAFKLKRAVRFPYVDFSTAARRLAACEAELRLNRRTAPKLYLGVRRITREADGCLAFDGGGELVDAIVEMRRFPQEALLDDMARQGGLTARIMTDLARRIAAFHHAAEPDRAHGGAAAVAAVLDINDRSLRETSLVPAHEADALALAFRRAFERHQHLLEARRTAGKVRRCHGDLILRNICLIDGEPTMFDCIEFDDALATIDVLYDLAFLLMDLWHRGQRELANLVFNRYLDQADESDGLALMPFFMAMRATVRAHVTAAQAEDGAGDATAVHAEARAYFDLARSLLASASARPALLAVGGLSGSGKSTVAALLAPRVGTAPGARVLASDRIRKRLHGVAAETRLPEAAYRREVSAEVYDVLRREAAAVLGAGWIAVVDAVFADPSEREAIAAVAAERGAPFHGFWLEAPVATLKDRISARTNDPSDATPEVLAAQTRYDLGAMTWTRVDAQNEAAAAKDAVLKRVGTS